jgi:hypothetical protein
MKNTERVLVITPEGIGFWFGPDREIYLTLAGVAEEAGLPPGSAVAIRVTSAEACHLADLLRRAADEAKTGCLSCNS